jgi:hypothetical protein
MKIIFSIFVFVLATTSVLAQKKKKKAHELEVNAGYVFYNPVYLISSTVDWAEIELSKHKVRYGLAYAYTTKRTRSQLNVGSYNVGYTFERSVGDFFSWQEYGGTVSQQWLEVGVLEGFKVADSLNLYPTVGMSYGFPIAGKSEGFKQTGSGITTNEDVTYNYDVAKGKRLDLRLGLMYSIKLEGKLGLNAYFLYSKSLLDHDIPGHTDPVGQYKVHQFFLNLGLTYSIPIK